MNKLVVQNCAYLEGPKYILNNMYQTELMVWSLVGKVIINKTQVTIIC